MKRKGIQPEIMPTVERKEWAGSVLSFTLKGGENKSAIFRLLVSVTEQCDQRIWGMRMSTER